MNQNKSKAQVEQDKLKALKNNKAKKELTMEIKDLNKLTEKVGLPDVDIKKFLGCGG